MNTFVYISPMFLSCSRSAHTLDHCRILITDFLDLMKLEVRTELSNFAARLCILQLDNGRDFIADNPQASKIWQLPLWQQVFDHERTVWVDHDQCMSGLTVPDIHASGKPIRFRKTTKSVASRWCLISLLNSRCNRDLKKQPHGRIEGKLNGKLVSQRAQ